MNSCRWAAVNEFKLSCHKEKTNYLVNIPIVIAIMPTVTAITTTTAAIFKYSGNLN